MSKLSTFISKKRRQADAKFHKRMISGFYQYLSELAFSNWSLFHQETKRERDMEMGLGISALGININDSE